ncbi:uncharacterized protein BJX67DRAFT_348199, partial [Aspergillus lucknowensis]
MPPSPQTVRPTPFTSRTPDPLQTRPPNVPRTLPHITPHTTTNDVTTSTPSLTHLLTKYQPDKTNLNPAPPNPTPPPPAEEIHRVLGCPTARPRAPPRGKPRRLRAHPRRERHCHGYRRRGHGDGRALLRAASCESGRARWACVWGGRAEDARQGEGGGGGA